VKVHNNAGADAPHTSAIGPATRMEAAATPDPISISSLTATGSDGQATLKFDAPKSHGKTSTVSCSMNPGGSCGTWPFPPSGQPGVVETLNGLTNGTATSVTLQECNGSSGTDFSGTSCVTSAPASVTTYGPIRNLVISTSVSGQNVNWSVSVDPNGRSANVHISNNHGWAHDYPTGTVGWSTNGSDAVGYSTNDTISVTVSDSGRASVSGSDGKTTGPPPVTITTWDGGLGTKQPGSCSGTCHTLNFQVHNFATGRFSWQCFNDSGMYYNSASYGYTISITNANQSFAGTSQSWCENTNGNTWIRINGVDSDHVYLGSG
jgi:large repetitive protein